jgi:hypothetical protein
LSSRKNSDPSDRHRLKGHGQKRFLALKAPINSE